MTLLPRSVLKKSFRWLIIGLTISAGIWMAYYEWQGLLEIRAGQKFVAIGEGIMALIFVTSCVPLWMISYAVFARQSYICLESLSVLFASGAFYGSILALTKLPSLWIQLLKGPFFSVPAESTWPGLHTVTDALSRLWLIFLPFVLAVGVYCACRTLFRRIWVRPPALNLKHDAF